MMRIRLLGASGLDMHVKLSASQVHLNGRYFELGPELTVEFQRSHWTLHRAKLSQIKILSPVRVHFEQADRCSDAMGPFSQIALTDGIVLDPRQRVLALKVIGEPQWKRSEDHSVWPRVIFSAAAPDDFPTALRNP